jgi:DNA-binding helix-hairpin-helix protein with protein kinase domain
MHMPEKRVVYNSNGKQIPLGPELGRGGEGIVFRLAQPEFLVKLYSQTLREEQRAKLLDMVQLKNERLLRISAWPYQIANDRFGQPIGFFMRYADGYKPVHMLYGPKSRISEFPGSTWKFLIHASANVARSFAVIHECGHVIGDVNESNVLVGRDATVALIDCDSFQVSAGNHTHLCRVGVPMHQPPEMQVPGAFEQEIRSPNHDNFGLAVLIFQLLFLGRHPYSGRYLGDGEMPIERAIREYRFAYGYQAAGRMMERPPHSLPLTSVPSELGLLFERAFAPEGSRPQGRPTAREWEQALQRLEEHLRTCPQNSSHLFLSQVSRCPWCELELSSRSTFFSPTVAVPPLNSQGFQLDAIWARISRISSPGGAPPLPDYRTIHADVSPEAVQQGRRRRTKLGVFTAVGVLSLMLTLAVLPVAPVTVSIAVGSFIGAAIMQNSGAGQRSTARKWVNSTRSEWKTLETKWIEEAGDHSFVNKLDSLKTVKKRYDELLSEQSKEIAKLEADARDRPKQMNEFLSRFPVTNTRIPKVGPTFLHTLSAYGVKTAADVWDIRVRAVPGFGEVRTNAMVAWRRSLERQFVHDPNKKPSATDLHRISVRFQGEKEGMERSLLAGPTELEQLRARILANRTLLQREIERSLEERARAEATWRAL